MTEPRHPERRDLAALRRVVTAIGRAEMAVAVAALTGATVIGIGQIALRYTTGRSLWWGQEVSILLMLVAYFVGAAAVYRLRYDVVVGFMVDRLPVGLRHPVYILAQVVTLVFWLTLAVQLIGMIPAGLRTYSAIMRIPKVYSMLPLIYASLSISVTTAYVLMARLDAGWTSPVDNLDDLDRRIRRGLGGEDHA